MSEWQFCGSYIGINTYPEVCIKSDFAIKLHVSGTPVYR
jgi:hypothetical protein